MAGRQSAATVKALRAVARGMSGYAAAAKYGIDRRTMYRALKQQRQQEAPTSGAGSAQAAPGQSA